MHRVLALAVLALVTLAACAPGPTAEPTNSAAASQPVATGSATAQTSPAATAVTLPGHSDTSWGRIWDALPPSFPAIPGAQPIEIVGDPVSAAFDLPAAAGDAADVARAFVDALGAAGWTTTVDGPLEDGSFVVDGARAGTLCVARVQVKPLGGIVALTVLYGADCAFA
jgi:ABC-type glycerol-3-phosphate transport system substrate-binding protein